MHPSPRNPTRLFTHGQARALTLIPALVLGLSLGCTQAPDPEATTAGAAPPPQGLPTPLVSEDQSQINQIPGAPAKQEAASKLRYAYPTILPELSVGAPMAVAPRAKIAQQDAYTFPPPPPPLVPEDRERYAKLTDNGVFLTQEQPVSTFSIDVDTGSYANVRRFLNQGQLPPKDAVRTEELLNYFDYAYPQPRDRAQPLALHTEIAPTPWNPATRLLLVGLQSYLPAERPAANLVFLIDVSGSMAAPNKLPLLVSAFKLLTAQLSARDRVSLVTYAGNAGVVLEPTPGDQRAKILAALEQLGAGGSTHGAAGIQSAYRLAEQARLPEGINRVILATDGDFNVGMVNHEALIQLIEQERAKGISLTTLGFGAGNYNDQLMEQLADKGNGNYAYLDTLQEARKVLVDELASTLETIAGDVKVQIEFNPAQVAEYRLIGYENRLLAREDFNHDRVDAGEVGAGHSVTALYEITLAGSPRPRIDPLRYGVASGASATTSAVPVGTGAELAFLKLRYKLPGQAESTLITQALTTPSSQPEASERLRFAAAVAAFGQYLRGGATLNGFTLADIITLANGAKGEDASGYRAEFVGLARLAQALPGA
jgi:Ca-activated chloride channel family protein